MADYCKLPLLEFSIEPSWVFGTRRPSGLRHNMKLQSVAGVARQHGSSAKEEEEEEEGGSQRCRRHIIVEYVCM